MTGYRASQVLNVAMRLGLPDLLGDGARTSDELAIFDRAMATITSGINRSLLEAHDFARYGAVVDVGGGNGALLLGLLEAHADLRGVLFDQPHVVSAASAHERPDVVAGSFFE